MRIEIPDVKKFILRALKRMAGVPMPNATLEEAVKNAFPGILTNEVHEAVNCLADDNYIDSVRDDLTNAPTWSLTPKGQHRVQSLG